MKDMTLERLENTIIVLKTMIFGKGFCKTEIEALKNAIEYLDRVKDVYIEYKKGDNND